MWALVARALLAGAMIAAISEIGRRLPATAAIVASRAWGDFGLAPEKLYEATASSRGAAAER